MYRHLHNRVPYTRFRYTTSELLLLAVAIGLVWTALSHVLVSPIAACAMLLAVAAIVALVHERASTRLRVRQLGERLNDVETLEKLEVVGASDVADLERALNRMIQQSREQAREAPAPLPVFAQPQAPVVGEGQTVAVLVIGARQGVVEPFTAEHLGWLAQTTKAVAQASGAENASIRMQNDGTLVVTCGAQEAQPVVVTVRQALGIAQALSSDPQLRTGLSCGTARLCTAADVAPTLVGAPFEEATRLYRMAASWHEYQLLCAEPIALLARSFSSQRTSLKLTHPLAPALPVYALDLASTPVAMSA
ncbi:MAG: hypothetical protein CYG59_11070 [Chloroflexi bacterium]|nr:MAG: hypothetical protein CYG59_11070 [Chloroflexota bacterium]